MKDLAFAIRSLRRGPGFTITAILTIGLGIGASTAIFSVIDTVLLRPLPYPKPDRLVLVWSELKNRQLTDFPLSPPDFDDLRHGATLLEDVAGVVTGRVTVSTEDARAEQLVTGAVTANFFRLMGARVAAGRDFVGSDGTPPPPAPPPGSSAAPLPEPPTMAILSDTFWRRRFAADPHVIGRSVDFGGGKAEIVGVLAPGFRLLFPPHAGIESDPDVWTALRVDYLNAPRNNVFLRVIARLKPGVTDGRARAELASLAAETRRRFAVWNTAGFDLTIEPMQERLVSKVRPALLATMGAVVFLLLIACANVGNLLLVRMALRSRELAVRAALGSGRWRLLRQMLVECLLLSLAGGALGLALASLGIDLLTALGPRDLPRLAEVSLHPAALGFALLATATAAALFGLAPALRASHPDLADVLRASGRTSGLGSGAFLRKAVVTAEVALSFVLLIGCGLMLRSFAALIKTDPGFNPRGLLTFSLPLNGARTPDQRAALSRDLRSRFEKLPGVAAVTAASPFPLDGGTANGRYGREDAMTDSSRFRQANFFTVLPGYFETLQTRLIAGRTFTEADNRPAANTIVIDDIIARNLFPHESAVGKRLAVRLRTPNPEMLEIVGVVAHQRHQSLASAGREGMFVTDGFFEFGGATRWALRTEGDPLRLAPLVERALADLSKSLAPAQVRPMQALVDEASAETRFVMILLGLFAVIAAILAAIGLYGVLANAVRQRTAEIGVRMAVGAEPLSILRLMAAEGLRLSTLGIALGALAAFALTRVLESMLVGVRSTDPMTYGVMAVVFLAVAMLACWIPARRAARLDPTLALREE